jgi:exodeoxyribonuclease VII small subunit
VASAKGKQEKTFEALLQEVETIVRSLQDGGVSLAEALALYEQGFAAVKTAQQRLTNAREKLEILQKDASGDEEESA